MHSPFVHQLLKPLDLSRPPSPVPIQQPTHQRDVLQATPETTVKQTLRSLLVSLNRPLSGPLVNDTLGSLVQLERSRSAATTSSATDTEENDLKQAILGRLVVGLYSEGLDICISQAMDAETQAEWWAEVGRSRRNVAWYLVQSASTGFSR
jgi:nuclear-control-of-ATPase protein 2